MTQTRTAQPLPDFDELLAGAQQEQLSSPSRPWWRRRPTRGSTSTPPVQASWTGGNALASKAASVLVVGALLTGPLALAGVLVVAAGEQAPVATALPAEVLEADAVVAGQRAQQWVRAWLSTPRDREEELRAFWSGRVQLPAVPVEVLETSVAGVRALEGGRWSVEVAALVRESAPLVEGASEPAPPLERTRFFQVPVAIAAAPQDAGGQVGGLQVRVLGLPAPVAGPQGVGDPARGYADALAVDSPVASVVAPFLAALVTGEGDVAPYLQPGTQVAVVDPPAAGAVRVRSVAPATADRAVLEREVPRDGDVVRVLAQIELVDTAAQNLASEYPLTLTARAGRWEVTSLDPAPLAPATDPTTAAPAPDAGSPAPDVAPSALPSPAASAPAGR